MKKIKKICFLAGIYPTEADPKAAVFYQILVHQFAKMGIDCRVIYPRPINYEKNKHKEIRIDKVDSSHSVTVYRPKTITMGSKKIGPVNTAYITSILYTYSAKSILKKINWKPDIFYGHFISPAGIMASKLSKDTGIPAFIAYGESEPWSIKTLGAERTRMELRDIRGFISVSTKNKKDLIDYKIATEEKIKVFPNAVDTSFFNKKNKLEARKKLGWDPNKFIVAFVGHFNERKGIIRLDEAIKNLSDVYVAYAGDGDLQPTSSNIVHKGVISRELMPWFLSAADIFVLPTLNEGSSNAIVESMACGLPIISSDREFNYDILNAKNSLLIDPENIDDIRGAIHKVFNSPELRKKLSDNSLKTAEELTIKKRAKNILKWMESKL